MILEIFQIDLYKV